MGECRKGGKKGRGEQVKGGRKREGIPVALHCMIVNRNERRGSGPKGNEVLYQ